MVEVRVSDPIGPRWVRVLHRCLGFGAAFLALYLFLSLFSTGTKVVAPSILLLAVLLVAQRSGRARSRSRSARLDVREGRIDIHHAGFLRQRVWAEDLVGASTARGSSGPTLALVRRHAKARPLLIDLATEDDLDRVRMALGIGHFGFGEISWPVGSRWQRGSIVGGLALLAFAVATTLLQIEAPEIGVPLSTAFVPVSFGYFVFLVWRLANPAPRPRVALTRHGLLLAEPSATITYVPYANVLGASVSPPHSVSVRTDGHPLVIAMERVLPEERDHLVAQIHSAAQRARGAGAAHLGLLQSLAVLAPQGRPNREWLERLDATAAALSSPSSRSVYRGPDIRAGDLVEALANPDAPAPVRAGAARVLARIAPAEATVQIARALAEERDDDTRTLLRVALEEDVEAAGRALDGWLGGAL